MGPRTVPQPPLERYHLDSGSDLGSCLVMPIDAELLEVLVCVECKKPLVYVAGGEGRAESLFCPESQLAYPFDEGGFPIMLIDEARRVDDTDVAALMARAER